MVEVPVTTLDAALGGRVPRLIKVNVEAFEAEVLAGAERTLSDPACAAVIMKLVRPVERYGATCDAIGARTRALGFTPCWYDSIARRLADPGQPRPFHWTQIFVRDMPFVEAKLASAPRFEVRGVSF